jgi:arylsulfatase A-like enzyme
MVSRRDVLAGGTAIAACTASRAWAAPAAARPNLLFILADDLGWADLGCYGRDDVATPALDRLARDGMKFEHGYANSSICSPTRVGLITGRYQHRLRIGLEEPLGAAPLGLEPGTPTLPAELKKAGYQTSLVGKWHLGSAAKFSPLKHGYEHFWGLRGGGVDYFTHGITLQAPGRSAAFAKDLWDGEVEISQTGYLTDLLGDRGAREIERMSRDPRPFLLSMHFTAPHWPWEAPGDEAIARKLGNSMHFDGGTIATYRAMVESLDRNVARVLAALDASGRTENTIVVFTSDNGGERFSKTWPFNGIKGELLEGGIRTPLLVRWPGRVARGALTQQVAISMDWMPTFLEAAGVEANRRPASDGMSLLPTLLEGKTSERELFWRYKANDQAAARSAQWKYLRIAGAEYLFDVVADPQERGNLRAHHPERFERLQSAWKQWNASMLAYTQDVSSWDNKAQRTLPDRY